MWLSSKTAVKTAIICFAFIAGSTSAQNVQEWDISLLVNGQSVSTARMFCLDGGACDASAWSIQIPGCNYELDFSVQFSGSLVRLLLFHESLDSTCSNIILGQAEGNGTANTAYPSAQNATGEVTLLYQTPAGTAGGTTQWQARRL
jgi:hypothetical protein